MKINDLKCDKCCGCKACAYACPKDAITFVKDEFGFEYPTIDEEKCIDCHKCEKSCPIHIEQKQDNVAVYAAINQNEKLLGTSASGGVFSALAASVLDKGGVVYGSAMSKDDNTILKVSHVRVDCEEQLSCLQGSKYVQSDMGDIFSQMRNDLKQGREVLFSGTPCQVAAVKATFGNAEKLLLVDIICHGVPSQQMFTEYLSELRKKNKGASIEKFAFRTKESGWGLCARLTTKKKNIVKHTRIPCNISSYYKMFLRCEIYRESCYTCSYTTKERVSDLTLGDYWGVEKISDVYAKCKENDIDITKGISCVISSSSKGEQYLREADLLLIPSDFEDVAAENGNLKHPSPCPNVRKSILQTYSNQGYVGLEKQFNKALGLKKYVILLRNRIPAQLRMKIKMLLRK